VDPGVGGGSGQAGLGLLSERLSESAPDPERTLTGRAGRNQRGTLWGVLGAVVVTDYR
jgi:hypothetical protein